MRAGLDALLDLPWEEVDLRSPYCPDCGTELGVQAQCQCGSRALYYDSRVCVARRTWLLPGAWFLRLRCRRRPCRAAPASPR